jgi:hypothetical protein
MSNDRFGARASTLTARERLVTVGEDSMANAATKTSTTLLAHEHDGRLAARPQTEHLSVERVVSLVRTGQLRLPDFQRKLKWEARDRLDLFDSIARGFPIGAILLWKRPAAAQIVRFRDLIIEASARPDALWIVDGQQRIATLASELLASDARTERKSIFYDWGADSFVERAHDADDRGLVPVRVALDATLLSEWVIDHGLARGERAVVFEMGKRLREFQISAYVVEAESDVVVRQLFGRINATGRALDQSEVFDALIGSTLPEGGIEGVHRRLQLLRFGELDETGVILRAFEAIADLPIARSKAMSLDGADTANTLRKVELALAKTVDFLQSDAAIPHADLIPYKLPVIVLAKFFARFAQPRAYTRRQLRRWLWRASLAQELGGASGAAADYLRLIDDDEIRSANALLATTDDRPELESFALFEQHSRRSARGKLELCALAALRPRDPATGEEFDRSTLFDRGLVGAVHVLARRSVNDVELQGSIANRVIAPRPLTVRELVTADDHTLASHSISRDAARAARRGDLTTFFAERFESLDRWSTQWFAERTDARRHERPPVSALRIVERSPE